jgi:membrane complex biogenesis BtpA family protein
MKLNSEFFEDKPLMAMVHARALPGSPRNSMGINKILEIAKNEASIYLKAGVDGIIVENMHDVPFVRKVGPEIVAAMTLMGKTIKLATELPCGIQILSAANKEALAAASIAGLDFIRVEAYAFAHVADEGVIEACAGELLRYRKAIGANEIAIFADIKKKHSSHAITGDMSIGQTAEAYEFFDADTLIVTGNITGDPPKVTDLEDAKNSCNIPVLLGSGMTVENLEKYFSKADGFIVGSYFKKEGYWANEIDEKRLTLFIRRLKELRKLKSKNS